MISAMLFHFLFGVELVSTLQPSGVRDMTLACHVMFHLIMKPHVAQMSFHSLQWSFQFLQAQRPITSIIASMVCLVCCHAYSVGAYFKFQNLICH